MSESANLALAGRTLSNERLVDAFGHISVREAGVMLMTPPRALGRLRDDEPLVSVALDAADLPDGAAREAWIHLAIYRARPDVLAICRAQPAAVLQAGVAALPIRSLHGQGAFLGREVPVFDDARLVRNHDRGVQLALTLGPAPALVMRGNGAVTAAASLGRAVALMYVLERAAEVNLGAAVVTEAPHELSTQEFDAWQGASGELLDRLWRHLADRAAAGRN